MKRNYLLLTALLASTQSMAQATPANVHCPAASNSIKVELVVFAQRSISQSIQWPRSLQLAYPEGSVALLPTTAQPPLATSVVIAQPPEAHQLNAEVEKLKRGPAARILVHESWCQEMNAAPGSSLAISGGEAQGEHQALEGSIRLWQDRTPHVDVNLWLTEMGTAQSTPLNGESPDISVNSPWPERPPRPGYLPTDSAPVDNAPSQVERIMQHHQQSALKPGELHYLDHPVIGVLISVTPATTAEGGTPTPSAPVSGSQAPQAVPQQ